MKQNMQIAISVSVVGVLYLLYTKYTEFAERQERLETNLKNVITAVNNHYISQMEDNETQTQTHESFTDTDTDNESNTTVDLGDESEEEDLGQLVTDRVYNEAYGDVSSDSGSTDSGPIQVTKNMHCPVMLAQGKNKGSMCGKKGVTQGYCKLHLKRIPVPMNQEDAAPVPEN